MEQRFEMFRQSWLAQGRVTGLEPPCDGAHFNQEELRWELSTNSEFFMDVIQGICQKNNCAVKLVFPPYEHPASDLPIIEILDNPDE